MPEKIRRVIKDSELLSVFTSPPVDWKVEAYRVDWDTATDSVLATTEYTTSMEYDALGRVTKMVYPEDVDNERKELTTTYNRSGALESVSMDGDVYVDRIAYNARGQKILTALGNGMMTRYVYRDDNFRLLRMKSEKYEKITAGNSVTYEKQSGTTKQNFTYEYDLSGNIISITDTTTGCGVGGSDELVREFEYDALYRLLSATGRETASTATRPWKDRYRPNDNSVSRAYTQYYDYDKLGNIQELQHVAPGGNFTRTFSYASGKNKLEEIEIGVNAYSFTHDVNGNIIQEDTNRHFVYDYADRLKAFYLQASTEEPSTYTQYFYDAGGNRVKKISRVQGGTSTKTTVYIDGIFEHTISSTSNSIPDLEIGPWVIGYGTGEQNTLHIMDGSSRVATRRIGDAMDDTTPSIKYNLEDHLGSSNLLLDTDGVLVSKDEYYPFGETSFGSYGKKRYRFCGKEKDDESGLYYYGLRYYNPWTCRFINIDPLAAKYPFYTPYQYAGNKPINFIDLDGAEPDGGTTQGGSNSPGLAEGEMGEVKNLPEIEVTGTRPSKPHHEEVMNIVFNYFDGKSKLVGGGTGGAGWWTQTRPIPGTGTQTEPLPPGATVPSVGPGAWLKIAFLFVLTAFVYVHKNQKEGKPAGDAPELKPDTENDESNDRILFRGMQRDEITGMPKIGETARTLGVRPKHEGVIYKDANANQDVEVDANGMVFQINNEGKAQGMSVAPDSPNNLKEHRKPPLFGGTSKDPIWSINKKQLPPGLIYIPDPVENPTHGVIAPEVPMPYEAYLNLLYSTAPLWKYVGK